MAVQNDDFPPNIPNSAAYHDISPPEYASQSHIYLQAVADEIRDLKAVNIKIATRASGRVEFVWNVLLQVFAALVGVSFGVFGLLAWTAAKKANSIAHQSQLVTLQANQLAMLSYCLTVPEANSSDACARVQGIERVQVATLVADIFGAVGVQAAGSGNGGEPSPATADPSNSALAGVIVGVVAAITSVTILITAIRKRTQSSFKQSLEQSVAEEKGARTANGKRDRGVPEPGVEVEPKDVAAMQSEEAGENAVTKVTVPDEEQVSEAVEPVALPWHRRQTGERDRHGEDGRV